MKRHWAPWRMAFIAGPKPKGCIFCTLPRKKYHPKNLILFRGKYNFVILNKYPYNSGHLMIVPFQHTCELMDLKPEENEEMMRLASQSVEVLKKRLKPQGFNLGMNLGDAAGAGIKEHLHLHVVPRWTGDTNFMPVLFDTKVLVEHLDSTFNRLAADFTKF